MGECVREGACECVCEGGRGCVSECVSVMMRMSECVSSVHETVYPRVDSPGKETPQTGASSLSGECEVEC